MTVYCWIATIICITGTIINVKRINLCFLLWVVGDIMWVIYDVGQTLWSRTMLDLLGLGLAVWGAYENLYKPYKKRLQNDKRK